MKFSTQFVFLLSIGGANAQSRRRRHLNNIKGGESSMSYASTLYAAKGSTTSRSKSSPTSAPTPMVSSLTYVYTYKYLCNCKSIFAKVSYHMLYLTPLLIDTQSLANVDLQSQKILYSKKIYLTVIVSLLMVTNSDML